MSSVGRYRSWNEHPRWRAAWAAITTALLAVVGLPIVQVWHVCGPDECGAHSIAATAPATHSHLPGHSAPPSSPAAPHDSSHCGLCAVIATLVSGGSTVPEAGVVLLLGTPSLAAVMTDQVCVVFEFDAAHAPRGPPRA